MLANLKDWLMCFPGWLFRETMTQAELSYFYQGCESLCGGVLGVDFLELTIVFCWRFFGFCATLKQNMTLFSWTKNLQNIIGGPFCRSSLSSQYYT
jgi:hypothetical protein